MAHTLTLRGKHIAMKTVTIAILGVLAFSLSSCHKLVEHHCTCRDFEGNFVEQTKYTGSETVAMDECSQRESTLNENAQAVELYTCTLD